MKTIKLLLAVFTVSLSVSCEKAEESIVNCLFEQALLDVHHSVSDENPLQVDLNVTYYGSETFDGYVIWDFGDGTPAQVLLGKDASHTYASGGTYTVKATLKINNGSCTFSPTETVHLK